MQDPEATQPIQRKQRHLATRLLFFNFASGASVTLFYFCLCLFLSSAPVSLPCFLIPLSTVSTAQQPATSTLLTLGEISLSPGDDPMKKKKKPNQNKNKLSKIHLQDSTFSEKVFLFPSWYFLISSSGLGSIPGSLHRLSARCTLPFLR